jgi:hypothetical protein
VHILLRMIYITEVRMSKGGKEHEHIEAVRWEHRGSPQKTGESTREEMIDWIRNKDGFVHVRDEGGNDIEVRVWGASTPYIRTVSDGVATDNLLSLPRYGVPPGEVA